MEAAWEDVSGFASITAGCCMQGAAALRAAHHWYHSKFNLRICQTIISMNGFIFIHKVKQNSQTGQTWLISFTITVNIKSRRTHSLFQYVSLSQIHQSLLSLTVGRDQACPDPSRHYPSQSRCCHLAVQYISPREAPDYGSRNALTIHPAVRLRNLSRTTTFMTDLWAPCST